MELDFAEIMVHEGVVWSCEPDGCDPDQVPAARFYDQGQCIEDAKDISRDWYLEYDSDSSLCEGMMLAPEEASSFLDGAEMYHYLETVAADQDGRKLFIFLSYELRRIIACRADDTGEALKNKVVEDAGWRISQDNTGIAWLSFDAQERLKTLFGHCSVREGAADDYTKELIRYYIEFAPEMEGGSNADFAARYCVEAASDIVVCDVDDGVVAELLGWIEEKALYPEREIEALEEAGVV